MKTTRIECITGFNAVAMDQDARILSRLDRGMQISSTHVTPGFERYLVVMISPLELIQQAEATDAAPPIAKSEPETPVRATKRGKKQGGGGPIKAAR